MGLILPASTYSIKKRKKIIYFFMLSFLSFCFRVWLLLQVMGNRGMCVYTDDAMSILITVYNGYHKEARRDMADWAVMSEHMSVHASLLMIQSARLNLESIDTIRLSLIWQANSSPDDRFLPCQCQPLNLFWRAALIEI